MKKTLLDIQQEIRSLHEKMKTICDSLSVLNDEINEMRNDDISVIDYESIRLKALNVRFGKLPLSRLEDFYGCKLYLETLLSLTQVDDGSDDTISRLIFIQWVLTETGIELSLEDLYKDSLQMTSEMFRELVEGIPKEYRKHLIVDAMITANLCGPAKEVLLSYIIHLCGLFGLEKEQVRTLSLIAKGVLKQELGRMEPEDLGLILTESKDFTHYLSEDLLRAGMVSQRIVAVAVKDNSYRSFAWKVKNKAQVKKGEVIAVEKEIKPVLAAKRKIPDKVGIKPVLVAKRKTSDRVEITAPCAGTLFQFRNDNTNYGVIAYESDNKDSIKAWTLETIGR